MSGKSGTLYRVMRIVFLVFCIAAFAFSITRENHRVHSLSNESSARVGGPGFTEVATYDGVMLVDGKLYDIYSNAGVSVKEDQNGIISAGGVSPADSTQTKDCKT